MAPAVASHPSCSRLSRAAGALLLTATLGGISLGEAGAQSSGAASVIVPVDPFRILDTRQGIGTGGVVAPVGADGTITLQVAGVGTVPGNATGIVLNITASEGTAPSFVTVWPTGTSRPEASVLNISPGLNLPNMITASLGSGGRVDLYNLAGNVHLIADVAAYLVPGGGGGQGPQGPAGPPGPTAASFAQKIGDIAILETPTEITKLSGAMNGGAITTTFASRLVIDGAVSGYNGGINTQFSSIKCQLQLSTGGGAFADVGPAMRAHAPGSTTLPFVYFSIALSAVTVRPAGTYDVTITCIDVQNSAGSLPFVATAAISVVAVAQ